MSKQEQTDISTKITKLNQYVEWFEGDDFTLEASIEKFNEAKKLADEIQKDLNDFKNKINVVQKQFDKE